jgi:parallel beta-helix repeat protein
VGAAGYFDNGKIAAGDKLLLRSGNHGSISLSNKNADFITIAADAGQTPLMSTLTLSGAKFIVRGLTIQSMSQAPIVELERSTNVILDGNFISSAANVMSWSQADWRSKSSNGVYTGSCTTLVNNKIARVATGIAIGYDNVMIDSNSLDYLGDDGMQNTASNVTIRHNRVTNFIDSGDGNHTDMIQSFNLTGTPCHDILIDGNIMIWKTDPNLPYPNPDVQGITEFDGPWTNFKIINNALVVNSWHGISLYGATNGQVINNTAFGTNPSMLPWIGIFDAKGGAHPVNSVLRNNMSNDIQTTTGVTADHNLAVSNPTTQIVSFDTKNIVFDLHLKTGASAIGAGNSSGAPAYDVNGFVRITPFDIGAYAAQDSK